MISPAKVTLLVGILTLDCYLTLWLIVRNVFPGGYKFNSADISCKCISKTNLQLITSGISQLNYLVTKSLKFFMLGFLLRCIS